MSKKKSVKSRQAPPELVNLKPAPTLEPVQLCPPHRLLLLNADNGYECKQCGCLLMLRQAQLFFAPKKELQELQEIKNTK